MDKAGLVDAVKVLLAEPALVFAERGRIGIALAGDGVEDAAAADAVKRPVEVGSLGSSSFLSTSGGKPWPWSLTRI